MSTWQALALVLGAWAGVRWLRHRGDRQGRILAVLDRYPGVELYGGDLARMAYATLLDVQMMTELADGRLQARPAPDGSGRRLYRRAGP